MTFHHKAQNAEQRASRAQHAMPCAKMSSPSCTSGEKRELNEQLVANVAPALQSLQQESQAAAKRHEALSAVTMAYMKLQVEALGKMNEKLDSHETRLQKVEERQKQADEHVARLKKLEKHQKQADDHEVRLKKLETLLIPKQRRVPSPPGERAFAQAAARASSKVHVRGPREPDGWCRLSVPVRKLLRSAAFARLKFSRVFHGALGNVKEWKKEIIPQELTPEYGREWPLGADRTFRIAMWLTKTERYRLPGVPGVGKRRWGPPPPGVALEPPARVGGHFD